MMFRVLKDGVKWLAYATDDPGVQFRGISPFEALDRLFLARVEGLLAPLDDEEATSMTLVLTPRYHPGMKDGAKDRRQEFKEEEKACLVFDRQAEDG